jgi:glutamate 5-kinase
MVASLVGADLLVILSTARGLIDLKGTGEVVPLIERITPEIEAMAGGTTSETSVGGMASKIAAVKIATRAGCGVFIASGAEPDIIPRLLAGAGPESSFFAPSGLPLEAKKRWLAYFQRPAGTIHVDANAVAALREGGHSLLAVGVTAASGAFEVGDVVNIAGPAGPVARGRTTFASFEISGIAGRKGDEVRALYPRRKRVEVVHRNDLVLL